MRYTKIRWPRNEDLQHSVPRSLSVAISQEYTWLERAITSEGTSLQSWLELRLKLVVILLQAPNSDGIEPERELSER